VVNLLERFGLVSESGGKIFNQLVDPSRFDPLLEEQTIAVRLNEERTKAGQTAVVEQAQLKEVSSQLWEALAAADYDLDSKSLDGVLENALKKENYKYEWVSHNALVGPLSTEGVIAAWMGVEDPTAGLLNPEFSDVGITARVVDDKQLGKVGVVVMVLGKPQRGTQTQQSRVSSTVQQRPVAIEVSDLEVMEALNAYRQSHKRPPLQQNEHLCRYAEKRVQDLVENGGLDNHAGFKKDFEDSENPPVGIRDYPAGKTIGENLAQQYCRNMQTGDSFVANSGAALIEWCFDSSTLGHREAQLSTQFKNFCVRHGQNMYVVIFGD
jgi:uncharacterized protein YkwD